MSIDVKAETLVHFTDARCEFHDGRRHALASLHRWRLDGVRGVKLETVLICGLRYTSKEAIDRFIAAQNADDVPASHAITATQRRRQSEAARLALQQAGI